MFFDVAICTPSGGPMFIVQIERNEWLEGPLWRVIVPNELLAGEETHITRGELVDVVTLIEAIQESVGAIAETLGRISARLKAPPAARAGLAPFGLKQTSVSAEQLAEWNVEEVLHLHAVHWLVPHERAGCFTCNLIAIRLGRV